MCGIAGVLGADDPTLVRGMLDRLAHRGPDGHATWSDAGITLGHRRLAIIDVATGQQPMADTSGRFVIVYNGELYNFRALRAELEGRGARFRTPSDTEVILEAWKAWGPDALPRFEGMFAFALWDTKTRTLVLARDRWGIKPLHITTVAGHLLWASEAKAFAAHPDFHFKLDETAFRVQAVLEFIPDLRTLFQDVTQVPPGHWMSFPADGSSTTTAFPALAPDQRADIDSAARAVADALRDSVQEQLMSEVPLGTILSGGLDSGTVATIHQALAGRDRPIQTFTLADSAAVEDFQVAHRLAATLGTQHHEATLAYDDVWRHLPQHALAQENTNYTESFFWFLFRFMRPHVTVGLCGQGSDELWGGYARYRKRMDLEQERAVRAARMQIPFQTAWGDAHRHAERLARFDQGGQLHNFQLRLVDRNSMTHSLEVRVPFLSSRLQALSDGTSWEWKLPKKDAEKLVLRKAADLLGVPKEVAWRPKVPAGTATSPTIVARLDAEAARLVPAKTGHVLLDALPKPMDRLMLGVWREVFEHRRGEASGVTLETVAANLGGRA